MGQLAKGSTQAAFWAVLEVLFGVVFVIFVIFSGDVLETDLDTDLDTDLAITLGVVTGVVANGSTQLSDPRLVFVCRPWETS